MLTFLLWVLLLFLCWPLALVALIPVAYTTGGDFKPAVRPPVEGITYWDTWGATRA